MSKQPEQKKFYIYNIPVIAVTTFFTIIITDDNNRMAGFKNKGNSLLTANICC